MLRSLLSSAAAALRRRPAARPAAPRPTYRPRLEALEDRAVPATLLTGFRERIVASGLVRPTALAHAPDGRILITQQDGALRVVSNNTLRAAPALTLNVNAEGERGLLGVTTDPNYLGNGYIYLYYTVPGTVPHNRVSRFTLRGDAVVRGSESVILELPGLTNRNHNGGAIHFGVDGKLYVAVGDNANPNIDPMATDTRLGKILRLNPNGGIPTDNPFYTTARRGNPVDPGDTRSIWAVGLRNPYTFAVKPRFGDVFINDVGAATWEEINRGRAGANFGWRATEGPTTARGITAPVHAYRHGDGPFQGNAIVGGTFYNPANNRFPRQFAGTYFYADLTGGWIHNLNARTGAVSRFALNIPVPVDLATRDDGALYYLARGRGDSGGILSAITFGPTDVRAGLLRAPASVRRAAPFAVSRDYAIAGASFLSNFRITYVASRDTVLGNAGDVTLGAETITAAADKRAGSYRGTSPALRIAQPGRWFLFAVLDSGLEIPEASERNNVLRTAGAITVV